MTKRKPGVFAGKPWLPAQVALMTELVEQAYASGTKPNWHFIAPQLGHPIESCKAKMSSIRSIAGAERSTRARMGKDGVAISALGTAAKVAAAPQSITAMIFGDPPPGRSALDQRAQAALPAITLPAMQQEI